MTEAARRPGAAPRHSETAALTTRTDQIERALQIAGDRIDPAVARRVAVALTGVRERLDLGVDHTVVALVGGTGSGKSSLFNAVTSFQFADVGVTRPTTSKVTACTWGGRAEALLDWLGIDRDRRIERESALLGDEEAALRGLVLLDLPDHDSIDPSHREVVDRLLPMVDLLVWVVDPQKYADDALHSGYLRRLQAHEAAMLVVLNQVDTVPAEQRDQLVADVGRLLDEDGLAAVPVLATSTRSRDGISAFRDRLAAAVGRRSVAAERAGAELHDAAALVAEEVAGPGPSSYPREEFVDAVVRAAGLPAIAAAIEAVVRGNDVRVPALGAVQVDTVRLARSRWLAVVDAALPPRWAAAMDDALPDVPAIAQAADDALRTVGTRARPSRAAAAVKLLAALALLVVMVWGSVALGTQLADARPGFVWQGWTPAAIVAVVALGLAAALFPGSLAVRRWSARRRGAKVMREGRDALTAVVDHLLVAPTAEVLADQKVVLELVGEPRMVGRPHHPSTG